MFPPYVAVPSDPKVYIESIIIVKKAKLQANTPKEEKKESFSILRYIEKGK